MTNPNSNPWGEQLLCPADDHTICPNWSGPCAVQMGSDCPEVWENAAHNDEDDYSVCEDPSNYDGGFGPGSYFDHAMNKDD